MTLRHPRTDTEYSVIPTHLLEETEPYELHCTGREVLTILAALTAASRDPARAGHVVVQAKRPSNPLKVLHI